MSVFNVPNAIVRPPQMKLERLEVREEGENVVLVIGDSEVRFHYETALKLSQWLRVRAKQAKKRAGDVSRHWSTLGVLEDLRG